MSTVQNVAGETVATIPDSGPPSVQEAWSRVMGDVTHLGKGERNAQQGFNFRGIDAVMNLVGPVLRTHGVSVIPARVDYSERDFVTKSGTAMHEVMVKVDWIIVGPLGDTLPGCSIGQASDAGDKAAPKAMSVAYRTFLLQALCLPTDEPDPDSVTVERGVAPVAQVEADKCAAGLVASTDLTKIDAVFDWAHGKGLFDHMVDDGSGTKVTLGRLFDLTRERLGDTSHAEARERMLQESLGATPVEGGQA